MSHLNKNSQAPNQKVTFREFNPSIFYNHTKTSDIYIYIYIYIYASSEGRGHSRNFALSKIYKIYFWSFTEEDNHQ